MLRDRYHVGPEVMVPLCVDKSVDMVVAILAVLKAGGAYVPLDPKHPAERLKYIVGNVDATVVLAHAQHAHLFDGVHVVVLDSSLDLTGCSDSNPVVADVQSSSLAYVIYTSGSTGQPKGVMIEHQSVVACIQGITSLYEVTSSSRFLQVANYTFDASVSDMFLTFVAGACLCLASSLRLLGSLSSICQSLRISHMDVTPTVAMLLNSDVVHCLEKLVLGGEAVPNALIEQWAPKCTVINTYGPTEATIMCVANRCSKAETAGSNIGRPVGTTVVYVLNEALQVVPLGAVGELCIGGPQLARGYLKDDVKTAAAFVSHPFVDGERLYRTGDLVRQLADGALEILGRRDTQVKLNGLRIDTGEVDAAVVGSGAAVQSYTALVEEDGGADGSNSSKQKKKHLSVFFVPAFVAAADDNGSDGEARLVDSDGNVQTMAAVQESVRVAMAHARTKLPEYMVPTRWVPVTRMPLNGSGKTDRRVLLSLMAGADGRRLAAYMGASTVKRAPQTDNERLLHGVWCELFGVAGDQVGRDDSFFQLGGDSILAIRLADRCRRQGLTVSVRDILEHGALSELALRVSTAHQKTATEQEVLAFGLCGAGSDRATVLERCASDLAAVGIKCTDVEDVLPTSQMQASLVALTLQDSAQYVAHFAYQLASAANVHQLQHALDAVTRHHSILRTTFMYSDTAVLADLGVEADAGMRLVQVVRTPDAAPVQWEHVQAAEGQTLQEAVQSFVTADQRRGMQLGQSFMRAAVVSDDGSHAFVWVLHHALYDGWSLQLLLRDLGTAFLGHDLSPRPSFGLYLRHVLDLEQSNASKTFWSKYLDGAAPTMYPRGDIVAASADVKERVGVTQTRLTVNLRSFSKATGITGATLLKGCWGLTLGVFANTQDVLFGSVWDGRGADVPQATHIAAPMMNTLLTRVCVDDQQMSATAVAFLRDLQSAGWQQQRFGHVGLRDVRRWAPTLGQGSTFQTLFNYVGDSSDPAEESPSFLSMPLSSGQLVMNYPVVIGCYPESDGTLHLTLRYQHAAVQEREAQSLFDTFVQICQVVLAQPNTKLCDIPLVLPQALKSAVPVNRDGARVRATESVSLLHELFETSVDQYPDHVAVDFDGGEQVSYHELNRRANQIARYLVAELGVQSECIVPLCLDKSPNMVAALLGVLKAGGAYAPMDSSHPATRLEHIIRESDARVVLTETAHAHIFGELQKAGVVTVVCVDALQATLAAYPDNNLQVGSLHGRNLAYVIYTSGSSGRPKGVLIEHRAAVHSLCGQMDVFALTPTSRLFQFANYVFDMSVSDFFVTLHAGATLCMASKLALLGNLDGVISRMRADCVVLTPTVIRTLDPTKVTGLRTLISGGERLSEQLISVWATKLRLVNRYGPTENAMFCVCHEVQASATAGNIVGSVFGSTQALILDKHQRLMPMGSVGELCLSGPQLARGYLKDDAKTAAVFVVHPLVPGERMYRTGDLARLRADGLLEIHGRIDSQVKLHGLRIEPGEIDSAVVSHAGAYQCCTLLAVVDGEPLLVAFVVTEVCRGDTFEMVADEYVPAVRDILRQVKAHVAAQLPRYMLPHRWVPVTRMPLNTSGKTDRRTLLQLLEQTIPEQLSKYVDDIDAKEPPQTENEQVLHDLWCQLFKLSPEAVGRGDSFFDLGGDSVQAILFIQLLRQVGLSVSMLALGTSPVLSDLALLLVPTSDAHSTGDSAMLVVPSPQPCVDDLFLVHCDNGLAEVFLPLSSHITRFNTVLLGSNRMHAPLSAKYQTLQEMASAYVQRVRSHRPHGPYYLGGYSYGGRVALAMANQLNCEGEDVKTVFLIDSLPRRRGTGPVEDIPGGLRGSLLSANNFVRQHATQVLATEMQNNGRLSEEYDQQPYSGRVVLFKAADEPNPEFRLLGDSGWGDFLPNLEVILASGDHFDILSAIHAPRLARQLETAYCGDLA
ncbi:hypothetical protein RI367_003518 [Sorochytrium milnesiophthora]